jgi:type IV secretory pathway component VirB8
MDGPSPQIAERIESGEYFKRARAWYKTIYIAPTSERTFFLIIASFAGVIALFGFIAVVRLLPMTERPGILIRGENIDDTVLKISKLKDRGVDINQSLINFFVASYVERREGYSAADYDVNYRFIHAQSDTPTFEKYVAGYDRANPKARPHDWSKPLSVVVTIRSIKISPITNFEEPAIATVEFTTRIDGRDSESRTNWTATLQFIYTDLQVIDDVDPKTGKK